LQFIDNSVGLIFGHPVYAQYIGQLYTDV